MPTLITNAQPASIYREGQLTDDGAWIVVNLKGKGGKYLEWVATGYEAATPAAMGAVVNALTSNSTTDPLAAAQGAALNAADIATFALTPAGLILTKKDGTTLPPVALPITVLDGNDKPVVRTNSTPNVAPTALEVPAPISGDTAQVILADKSIEFWSYTAAWAKVSTISYVTATAFTALYGTITNTSPSATTDAVANWGLLGDAIPTNADRFYFAATALAGGNGTNKTVTGANLKAFLATPDEIVDVSGVTFPIAFPITTLPGAPVFAPATPASTTAVYKIVTGGNLAYAAWNGTQYISAPAPVATTVSNTVAGVGAARTISTTINGVTSTPVAIPDANNNILSIGGTAATPTISNDGGTNFVNLPSVPPTTNTLAITKANGAISTVQGVAGSQPIPAGTIIETLGYNAAGQAVYQAIPAPVVQSFYRSGTGATLPDGTTDTTENISRIGKQGFGIADPSTVVFTSEFDNTIGERQAAIGNASNICTIPPAIIDSKSVVVITQLTTDAALLFGNTNLATRVGQRFQVVNSDLSTHKISYLGYDIHPNQTLNFVHNGRMWQIEEIGINSDLQLETAVTVKPTSTTASGSFAVVPGGIQSSTTQWVEVPGTSFVAIAGGEYAVKYVAYASCSSALNSPAVGNGFRIAVGSNVISGTVQPTDPATGRVVPTSEALITNLAANQIDSYTKTVVVLAKPGETIQLQMNSVSGSQIVYQSATQNSRLEYAKIVSTTVTPPSDVVTVNGATLPLAFPVATIPGTPVFSPANPAASNILYAFPNGQTAIWNGAQYVNYVAPQAQTLFAPNNIVNGFAVGANIPATAQGFRVTDGSGYASPLVLPPVDIYSEPITISNFATGNIQVAVINQAGGGPQTIINGGQIAFVPTTSGWQEEHAKLVNGHTKFSVRGTYAAPLTGAITFPAFSHQDFLLIVGAGATIPLPAANIWVGRRLEIKKSGAGIVTFTGTQTIDGVAGRTLSNPDESLTLTSDGATWARI